MAKNANNRLNRDLIKNLRSAPQSKVASGINKNWIIAILLILLILAAGFILTDRVIQANALYSYLSFTATLLSIILSVVAIMYSYFSTIVNERQMAEVTAAVTEIKATNRNINDNNQLMNDTIIALLEKVSAINAKQDVYMANLTPNQIKAKEEHQVHEIPKNAEG